MNFQLHLPHGFFLFAICAVAAWLVGKYLMRFCQRNDPRDSESTMGEGIGALLFCAFAGVIALVGVVMMFLCPYSAYAFLLAIAVFAAGVESGRKSSRR
jgi:hypothetical protein